MQRRVSDIPTRSSRSLFARLCLAALAAIMLSGCATKHSADPTRGTSSHLTEPTPLTWPSRDIELADKTIGMAPGKQRVYLTGIDQTGAGVRPVRWSAPVMVKRRERAGQGIVCEIKRLDREAMPDDPDVFLFFSSDTPVVTEKTNAEPGTPLDAMVFRVYPAREGAVRGVAIVLRPISGAAYTRSTLNQLRDRGFTVIETGWSFGAKGIGITREALNDGALDAIGHDVAQLIDARLAETSFGVEAMLELLRRDRPELASAPLAVVGFSAGAIGAPTVCARLGSQVRAAVLVGGGVNVLRIAQTSALSDFGLTIRRSGRSLSASQVDRLCNAYLNASTLDPYHAAPLLGKTPTLMLHAIADKIVPSATGETLFERLDRPERWTFPMGHELLFLRLAEYDAQIADWLQSAIAIRFASHSDESQGQ